jgi:hypothetical protein
MEGTADLAACEAATDYKSRCSNIVTQMLRTLLPSLENDLPRDHSLNRSVSQSRVATSQVSQLFPHNGQLLLIVKSPELAPHDTRRAGMAYAGPPRPDSAVRSNAADPLSRLASEFEWHVAKVATIHAC